MAVSSTSINVGSMTDGVTSHGLTPWVSGYRSSGVFQLWGLVWAPTASKVAVVMGY